MRCPFAVWKPLPENNTADRIDPRIVILHTAVANVTTLYGYFSRLDETLESTFFINNFGIIEQYMDTERQADANRYANDFAISVENQDNAANPIAPMTPAQLDANIRLFRWCSDVHPKIKRQRCDRWDGSGYGYHTMWGAPSMWTPVSKSCPSPARIKQFEEIMIPSLVAPAPAVTGKKDISMEAALLLIKIHYDNVRGDGRGSYDVAKSDPVGWQHWLNELLARHDAGQPLKPLTDIVGALLFEREGKK